MRIKTLPLMIAALCFNVYADDLDDPLDVADHGAELFQVQCAYCHDRDLPRMPGRADLKSKDPRDVYAAISGGVMAPYGRGLTSAERRAITEYATGQSLGAFSSVDSTIPKSAYCTSQPNPITDVNDGWNSWGNSLNNSRFQTSERAGMGVDDVKKLKLKWAFGVPAVSTMSAHPAVIGDRLYFGTFSGLVVALDADTGCAHWVFEASGGIRTAITAGQLGDGSVSLFFGDLSGRVYAIDPDTGEERWSIVADDHPHVRITGTPVYHDDRLYVPLSSLEEVAGAMPDYECCTFRGGVVKLDANTGNLLWKTHSIAETPTKRGKNRAGAQLWAPSGAAVWSAPTLDPKSNSVYVVTGDSYSDPAAPESDAVMAIAMDTGEVKWIRQTLAGDAYTIACMDDSEIGSIGCPESAGPDLDFGSSPILVTTKSGTELLLAGQKSGWLYALNPKTGEIVWQSEVGRGGIVGGIEWGFGVDDERAYVAIAEAWELGPEEAGGIVAVNLDDGKIVWNVEPHKGTCTNRDRCNTGQLAAVSVIPGAVFSGSLDGHLRAYSTADGSVLWDTDTRQSFKTVNTVAAKGGSLNGPGPAIANGHVYVMSGYGMWNLWTPGNALVAYSIDGK